MSEQLSHPILGHFNVVSCAAFTYVVQYIRAYSSNEVTSLVLNTLGISASDVASGRLMPVDFLPGMGVPCYRMSPRDREADRIASAQQTLDGMQ